MVMATKLSAEADVEVMMRALSLIRWLFVAERDAIIAARYKTTPTTAASTSNTIVTTMEAEQALRFS